MDRAAIERQLAACQTFAEPSAELEQYATPATIAAHIVHLAGLQGDLARTVLDLGSGTGMLTLGASLAGADEVTGLERDADAISIARMNARELGLSQSVAWILADVHRIPLNPPAPVTVLANPPFGAVDGSSGADRAFLETISSIAAVSYTIHNAGSMSFIESFVADHGGQVTRAYQAEFEIPRQFAWHEADRESIPVEVVRVDWQ